MFSALATLMLPLAIFAADLDASPGRRVARRAHRDRRRDEHDRRRRRASLELLAHASEAAPLLLLIDDAQWIDPASAAALVFALRRLDAEPVGALVAVRAAEPSGFDGAGFDELDLQGLDATSGIDAAPHHGPGRRPRREAVLVRRRRQSPGAARGRRPPRRRPARRQPPARPAPPRRPLGARLRAPTRSASARTRTALLVAAVADRGDLGPIEQRAARGSTSPDAFAPAERADVVVIADGVIDFRHPLLRATILRGRCARSAAPRIAPLADALTDPRTPTGAAWHLAGAAIGPDARSRRRTHRRRRSGAATRRSPRARRGTLEPRGPAHRPNRRSPSNASSRRRSRTGMRRPSRARRCPSTR